MGELAQDWRRSRTGNARIWNKDVECRVVPPSGGGQGGILPGPGPGSRSWFLVLLTLRRLAGVEELGDGLGDLAGPGAVAGAFLEHLQDERSQALGQLGVDLAGV